MITVEEFMTAEPWTMRETDSVNDARQIMSEKHIRHIPVTDSDSHLIGLVTQRDILAATDPGVLTKAASASNGSEADVELSAIMVRDVSVISRTDSLRTAATYLQAHKYGCLPVVADDRLVGIITDSDFVDIAINLIEQAEINEEELGTEGAI